MTQMRTDIKSVDWKATLAPEQVIVQYTYADGSTAQRNKLVENMGPQEREYYGVSNSGLPFPMRPKGAIFF